MRTNAIETGKYVVLLIGASRYDTNKYADILNVEANIEEMKNIFLDKRYIGVKERNLFISLNEDSKAVEHIITDACRAAKNSDYTLFVYYSGHGIINPDNYKLYFATSTMDVNYLDTEAIEAKTILDKISRSAASRKIFVVDACHSGGIHNTMGDTTEASLMKNYEGVHYVSACDEDSTALFNKRKPDEPTYFTGALVNRIKYGMDISHSELTLREIVDDIASDFRFKNLPTPQQSCMLNVDRMPFAHNVRAKKISADNSNCGKIVDFSNTRTNYDDITESKTIKNDNKMWDIACSINTIDKYNDYLSVFPNGIHGKEAKSRISVLNSKAARKHSIIFAIVAAVFAMVMVLKPTNDSFNNPNETTVMVNTLGPNDSTTTVEAVAIDIPRNVVDRKEFPNKTELEQADELASLDSTHWKNAIKLYNTALSHDPDNKEILAKKNTLQRKINAACYPLLQKVYTCAHVLSRPAMKEEAISQMKIVLNITNLSMYEELMDLIVDGSDQNAISDWMKAHPIPEP